MDDLTQAVEATDLPALIHSLHPDSGARPGTTNTVFAVWRGNRNTPSFSLYRHGGVWLYSDKATGESGNAFNFLVDIHGMDAKEAGEFLKEAAGVMPDPDGARSDRPRAPRKKEPKPAERIPVEEDEQTKFLRLAVEGGPHRPKAMAKRGFKGSDLDDFMIVDDNGDARIPMFSPDGELLTIKRRVLNPGNGPKYRYEISGHGAPPWSSPNLGSQEVPAVLICEGELDGMIAYSVARERDWNIAVMGVAGSEGRLYLENLKDRTVYVTADDDEAGRKAKERWAEEAEYAGAKNVYRVEPFGLGDFCDQAARGRNEFAASLQEAMRDARNAHEGDRRIGAYSIAELRRSAERYMSGEILLPTGFEELDHLSGGMPENDITLVGALPGVGKSSFLRTALLTHIDQKPRNKVLLFSPDQSVSSIFRLIASYRSGVPAKSVRTGSYPHIVLRKHGSPDAARKAWWEAYDDALLNLSKRLIISEKQEWEEVKQEVYQAVEAGATMVGFDYMQQFQVDDSKEQHGEKKVMRDLKAISTNVCKVPVVAAIQLAKSKFSANRKSGIPIVSDIEGHGVYHQLANQILLLYNQDKYMSMFGHDAVSYGAWDELDSGKARVMVAKNKEDESGGFKYLRWEPALVRFRSMTDPA